MWVKTAQRWLYVFGLAVVTVAARIVFDRLLGGVQIQVQGFWAGAHAWHIWFVLLTFAPLATAPLIWDFAFRWTHWCKWDSVACQLRYPPAWLGAFLGLTASLALLGPGSRYQYGDWGWSFLVMLIGMLLAGLMTSCAAWWTGISCRAAGPTSLDPPATGSAGVRKFEHDGAGLITWLSREMPISRIEQDAFAYKRIADRLVDRISLPVPQAVALVGPWGAGKSSIIALARQLLAERARTTKTRIWTCVVDGWGLSSHETAAGYILTRAVGAVGSRVDATALIGIPGSYTSALSATNSLWSAAASGLLGQPSDPIDTLRRFDPVLGAANARLVIFLEDLDRHASNALLSDIAATLDRLRHLHNVTFVLAVTQAATFDLQRLCRWTDRVPSLRLQDVRTVIHVFRMHCLAYHEPEADPDLDPARADDRRTFAAPDNAFAANMLAQIHTTAEVAVAGLLRTPRQLKAALFRSWQMWQSLHGEIDLDDLIMLNTLQIGAPVAYHFLSEQASLLYRLQNSSGTEDEDLQTKRRALREEWKALARASKDTRTTEFAEALLAELFPTWRPNSGAGHPARPQAIAASRRYWQRSEAQTIAADEARDQLVLRAIRDWKQNRSPGAPLLKHLTDNEDFASMLEHFVLSRTDDAFRLNPQEICDLARKLFGVALSTYGRQTSYGKVEGFIPLWRALFHGRTPEGYAQFVMSAIDLAMPRSIHFALDIEYYWGSASNKVRLVTAAEAAQIRNSVVDSARKHISNAEALLDALDPTYPYTLHHLIRSSHLSEATTNVKDWQWLASTVLDAALLCPTEVIPQVARLVVKPEADSSVQEGKPLAPGMLDTAFIDEFFSNPADCRRLHALLERM